MNRYGCYDARRHPSPALRDLAVVTGETAHHAAQNYVDRGGELSVTEDDVVVVGVVRLGPRYVPQPPTVVRLSVVCLEVVPDVRSEGGAA
ncbi:MAG: hypothetical protein AAGH15_19920 [Myxococcota bacterium]